MSRAARALVAAALFFGLVAVAVVAAPALHRATVAWGWQDPGEFGQTFRHAVLAAIVLWILAVLRPWRDAPKGAWGLVGPDAKPSRFPAGFALACGLLLAIVLFEAALGWMRWETDAASKFRHRFLAALLTSIPIGLAEEALFRGWVFGAFRRRFAALSAAALASLVYAVPHAFKGSAAGRDLPADLSGALTALGAWGDYVGDLSVFGPKVVGLFAFGMLLCAAYLRTRTLWFGAGIHAGAVFFLKAYGALTEKVPERNWGGTKFLYDGLPAYVLVGAVAFCLWPKPVREGGLPAATGGEPPVHPGE